MANIITSIRIICSIVLLFCPVFSPVFYTFYITAGFSDIVDGIVARKTNTISNLGSKFDTIADFIFLVMCLIKIIPLLHISNWLIIWIIIIAVIKVLNLIFGYIIRKEIIVLHTVMNKLTGILLFIFPLTLTFIDLKYSEIFISTIATFAAINEGHQIRTNTKSNI